MGVAEPGRIATGSHQSAACAGTGDDQARCLVEDTGIPSRHTVKIIETRHKRQDDEAFSPAFDSAV